MKVSLTMSERIKTKRSRASDILTIIGLGRFPSGQMEERDWPNSLWEAVCGSDWPSDWWKCPLLRAQSIRDLFLLCFSKAPVSQWYKTDQSDFGKYIIERSYCSADSSLRKKGKHKKNYTIFQLHVSSQHFSVSWSINE